MQEAHGLSERSLPSTRSGGYLHGQFRWLATGVMSSICMRACAGGIHTFQFIYFFSSFWGQFGPNCTTFLLAGAAVC